MRTKEDIRRDIAQRGLLIGYGEQNEIRLHINNKELRKQQRKDVKLLHKMNKEEGNK